MCGLRVVVNCVYLGDHPEISRADADEILTSSLFTLQSYLCRS
jgi:hypothetical protein